MYRCRNFFRFSSRRNFSSRASSTFFRNPGFSKSVAASVIGTSVFLSLRGAYPLKATRDDDDSEVKLSRRQQRFRDFASVEFNGCEYMTPQDFLDCLILDEPRERVFRKVLNADTVWKMLKKTPPLRKGGSTMFRQLSHNGLISYAEYVFLITLLTKSQQSFRIAFTMFDDDDNMRIDKEEFLKIRSLILNLRTERSPEEDSCFKECELSTFDISTGATMEDFNKLADFVPQTLKELMRKKQVPNAGDPSTSRDSTQDLAVKQETTIVVHLFGLSGRDSLSFDQFKIFYENLQKELIEIEFQEFSRGKEEISAVDFARLVLRYSLVQKNDQSPYLQRVFDRSPIGEKGVTLAQFEQFSMFLNNLEEFTKAVRLYTAAELPVSRAEFIRAVKCSTGFELDPLVVEVLYRIFDANNDDRLSYSEFIAIMNDRLHRGFKSHTKNNFSGWQLFRDCVIKEISIDHLRINSMDDAKALVCHLKPNEKDLLKKALKENLQNENINMEPFTDLNPAQLRRLFVVNMMPFIGFGLLDNMIMILAGEYIDQSLGALLSISTMAAAALGNIISDVAGVGLAHYVELFFNKMGIKQPPLSSEQLESAKARFIVNAARAVGLVIGCLIGMFPLLFFDSTS
ncbi:hypothetical protein FO519_006085 [Halicephalobus sp. NKZ332]|nr:hypothetical protein FO519_006085 [Halicephalobus sp. NKZ332]